MLSHCYDLNWDNEDDERTELANGIVLTVGFVPGLKVDAIPLLRPTKVMDLQHSLTAAFLYRIGVA